ncbi:T-box transcription factor TBX21 [Lates japonicus]|uniref:T-box transcription factor TBX21 n=1 Tax=Lates japonicus TaxID=270547 RepID=A0AAD3NLL6_LATJO|nr:T-box transcription factor TBX21 [Lates japonicus]
MSPCERVSLWSVEPIGMGQQHKDPSSSPSPQPLTSASPCPSATTQTIRAHQRVCISSHLGRLEHQPPTPSTSVTPSKPGPSLAGLRPISSSSHLLLSPGNPRLHSLLGLEPLHPPLLRRFQRHCGSGGEDRSTSVKSADSAD